MINKKKKRFMTSINNFQYLFLIS